MQKAKPSPRSMPAKPVPSVQSGVRKWTAASVSYQAGPELPAPTRKACPATRQAVRIRPTSPGVFAARSCSSISSADSSRDGREHPGQQGPEGRAVEEHARVRGRLARRPAFVADAAALQAQARGASDSSGSRDDLVDPPDRVQRARPEGADVVRPPRLGQVLLVLRGEDREPPLARGQGQGVADDGPVAGEQQHVRGQGTDDRIQARLDQRLDDPSTPQFIHRPIHVSPPRPLRSGRDSRLRRSSAGQRPGQVSPPSQGLDGVREHQRDRARLAPAATRHQEQRARCLGHWPRAFRPARAASSDTLAASASGSQGRAGLRSPPASAASPSVAA